MRVLLIIVPPTSVDYPLLGVASISAVTKMNGCSVTIRDINLATYLDGRIRHTFWEINNVDMWYEDKFFARAWLVVKNILVTEILTDNELEHFDAIGIHVNYASLRMASNVVTVIKEHFPDLPIAVGGPAFFTSKACDIQWADVIFRGEAELAWQLWLKNGCSQRGVIEALPIDMNNLPLPEFSSFPNGYKHGKILPIETSRGCINRCAFCRDAQTWGRLRMKSPQHLAMDLASAREYGATHVSCMDSIVNSSVSRLLDIMPIFKSSGLSWDGMFQVRGINDDIAARLQDSGCKYVFLGVESFSPGLLRYLNKSHVSKGAALAIQALGSIKIPVSIGLIIAGPPFQSWDEFNTDVDAIIALAPYFHSVVINPLCIADNTPLLNVASALGVQGLEEFNGWKLWHCGDKQRDVYRRYEWSCIAIKAFQSAGISTADVNGMAQYFEI